MTVAHVLALLWRSEDTCGSQFSLSTLWVLGIELGSSVCVHLSAEPRMCRILFAQLFQKWEAELRTLSVESFLQGLLARMAQVGSSECLGEKGAKP